MSILNPPVASQSASTWCGVETYWGKIGDGKTHHLVKFRVLPALAQGRHVFTNIDFGGAFTLEDGTVLLNEEERAGALLSQYLKKDVRPFFHIVTNDWFKANLVLNDMDGALLKVPRGSRIIIDEAQMLFPIDGYRSADPRFFKLLTYCRHFDIDFMFATQNTALLDKRIVSTSNELIMIKNLWFLTTFFKNRYQESHHQNLYAEPHQKKMLGFDTPIFELYKSSGSVVKRQGRAIPSFLVLPFLGLLFVFGHYVVKGHKSTFLRGSGFEKRTETALPVVSVPPPLSSTLSEVKPLPPGHMTASQAILELRNMADYRDAPGSFSVSYDSDTLPSEKYHTVYGGGRIRVKGRWVKGRDGVSTWQAAK